MHPFVDPCAQLQYSAVFSADVTLIDPGQGPQVNLLLRGGLILRVKAGPDLLRLGSAMQGQYRADLSLRTSVQGLLKPPLRLLRLTRDAAPIEHPSRTCWSATGLVAAGGNSLLVFQERYVSPLRLTFQAERGVHLDPTVGQTLQVQGVLRRERLIATAVRYSDALEMPQHWQRYVPNPGR